MKNDEYVEFDFKKIISYRHLPLILLIIIGLALNIYYFNTNKAVWWDEAEYLSFGKYFGSSIPYSMSETRAINYPIMLFLFSKIFSGNESILRILLLIISIFTICASYLFLKKAFNAKIAFISTLMLLTNYLYLFFQIRFLTEIPSLMFMLIGLYFFMKEKSNKNNILTGLFIGLSIATRFTSLLILMPMVIYQFLKKEKIRDYSWLLFVILGFIPSIITDLARNFAPFSEFFMMFSHNQNATKSNPSYFIESFGGIFGALTVPFFIFGIITMILRAKKKKSDFLKMLLVLMFFIVHFLFYSLFSAWKEDRYMLNILPFYYCIVGFGIFDALSLFLKKISENYKKIMAAMIILIIIMPNIQTGNSSILLKSESYKQVKDMAELAKNIIPLDSKIITNAPPQVSYYGEREILSLPAKINDLYELLNLENNTDTIILSVFEGVPEYVQDFNSANFTILNAGFLENQSVVFLIQYNRN